MYIEYFFEREKYFDRRKNDILEMLSMPTDKEVRSCVNCKDTCTCELKSQFCCCMCSADCSLAPKQLSSDPVNYPIEKNILPLVYALMASRIVQPCWSCEGHLDEEGYIGKLPQVWFYSPSVVYPDLISQYLISFLVKKHLENTWKVSVNQYNRDNFSTLFIIQPRLENKQTTDLKSLHRDIKVIADNFEFQLRATAKNQLNDLKRQILQAGEGLQQ